MCKHHRLAMIAVGDPARKGRWSKARPDFSAASVRLSFAAGVPEIVGSHWSRTVQADLVAINWTVRAILIGECKWGDAAVDRQTVRDLIERTVPLTLADLPDGDRGWQVFSALFASVGATPAARKTLTLAQGIEVD